MKRAAAALIALYLAASASAESRRPLLTEDLETLDDSELEVQVALDVVHDFVSPLGNRTGSLIRVPVIGINYGVGGRTELQLRVPVRQRFDIDGGPVRSATGDVTLGTKFRVRGGKGIWPGFGVRAQVKLPNISEVSGIGTDETDVRLEAIAGMELAGAIIAGNIGYAILGDPTERASQNDKVILGAGFLRPVGSYEVGGDVHSERWGDPGFPDEWALTAGGARLVGRVRLDAGVGVHSRDAERSLLVTVGGTVRLRTR